MKNFNFIKAYEPNIYSSVSFVENNIDEDLTAAVRQADEAVLYILNSVVKNSTGFYADLVSLQMSGRATLDVVKGLYYVHQARLLNAKGLPINTEMLLQHLYYVIVWYYSLVAQTADTSAGDEVTLLVRSFRKQREDKLEESLEAAQQALDIHDYGGAIVKLELIKELSVARVEAKLKEVLQAQEQYVNSYGWSNLLLLGQYRRRCLDMLSLAISLKVNKVFEQAIKAKAFADIQETLECLKEYDFDNYVDKQLIYHRELATYQWNMGLKEQQNLAVDMDRQSRESAAKLEKEREVKLQNELDEFVEAIDELLDKDEYEIALEKINKSSGYKQSFIDYMFVLVSKAQQDYTDKKAREEEKRRKAEIKKKVAELQVSIDQCVSKEEYETALRLIENNRKLAPIIFKRRAKQITELRDKQLLTRALSQVVRSNFFRVLNLQIQELVKKRNFDQAGKLLEFIQSFDEGLYNNKVAELQEQKRVYKQRMAWKAIQNLEANAGRQQAVKVQQEYQLGLIKRQKFIDKLWNSVEEKLKTKQFAKGLEEIKACNTLEDACLDFMMALVKQEESLERERQRRRELQEREKRRQEEIRAIMQKVNEFRKLFKYDEALELIRGKAYLDSSYFGNQESITLNDKRNLDEKIREVVRRGDALARERRFDELGMYIKAEGNLPPDMIRDDKERWNNDYKKFECWLKEEVYGFGQDFEGAIAFLNSHHHCCSVLVEKLIAKVQKEQERIRQEQERIREEHDQRIREEKLQRINNIKGKINEYCAHKQYDAALDLIKNNDSLDSILFRDLRMDVKAQQAAFLAKLKNQVDYKCGYHQYELAIELLQNHREADKASIDREIIRVKNLWSNYISRKNNEKLDIIFAEVDRLVAAKEFDRAIELLRTNTHLNRDRVNAKLREVMEIKKQKSGFWSRIFDIFS